MSGLSWGEFAERLGVTQRGLAEVAQGRAAFGGLLVGHHRAGPRDVPGGFELILDGDADTEVEDPRTPPWPEDFPARLGRLEDLSGISLEKFASVFGLPEERAEEWRSGGMPTTDEVWAMALWAGQVPGGSAALFAPYPLTGQGWE